MFVTIINDCRDVNAMGRQATRAAKHFGNVSIHTVGIDWHELEGAGNLIDMIDAADHDTGIIMANVAPRHGRGKKWPNGTPFGFFWYKKILVVSTIAEQMLSLAKKFDLAKELQLTDIATVVDAMIERGKLPKDMRDIIVTSQFRSYDYMPRLAKWVWEGENVPSETYSFANVEDVKPTIWWVDNFGNCKTTVLPSEIGFEAGKTIKTKFGEIKCYDHLKDVSNDEPALIVGSSGLREKRFLEIVVQGKSAAKHFGLKVGDEIL